MNDLLPSIAFLEALALAGEQLRRAEDLSEASGHRAAAALARASRGQLCGLAAEAVGEAKQVPEVVRGVVQR